MLTIDDTIIEFNDGTSISWNCTKNFRSHRAPNSTFSEMDDDHLNVVISQEPITITVSSVKSSILVIQAPVTVRSIFEALKEFFSTKISNEEYENMAQTNELRNWNSRIFPTMDEFKKRVKTYGDFKGDRVFYENMEKENENDIYNVNGGS